MNRSTAATWKALVTGESGVIRDASNDAGRLDLRGLHLSKPETSKIMGEGSIEISELSEVTEVRDRSWKRLDFSNSILPSLRFFNTTIDDCNFENCELNDLRMWGTKLVDVSFRGADMRKSALGPFNNRTANSFERVDFSFSDLRGTTYQSANFHQCEFFNSCLRKVDFQGSIFVNCAFKGELREVLFYSKGFGLDAAPRNEMDTVDFSGASLRWCAFRGLNLDKVIFPNDADHIVVEDYPELIDRLLNLFGGRPNPGYRSLTAVLTDARKWLGPKQNIGLFNRNDLIDMLGVPGEEEVSEIIRQFSI